MKNQELTEQQLKEIEKRVFEDLPIRPHELMGTFCAAKKRAAKEMRERYRQKLIAEELEKLNIYET